MRGESTARAGGERAGAAAITVRRLAPTDSVAELTGLLHRAYAGQVAMGLRPLAGRQDEATTRRRCGSGECYVAVMRGAMGARGHGGNGPGGNGDGAGGTLVGTILFQEVEEAAFPAWFQRPEVAHFSLFGVEPGMQGRGIGGLLLGAVEGRARELGFAELALSMAEPDVGLARFYEHRGYRFVEYWQWPYTNYRSLILSRGV